MSLRSVLAERVGCCVDVRPTPLILLILCQVPVHARHFVFGS